MERKQGSRTVAGAPEEFGEVYEGHLGGCALLGDGATYYPRMWEAMVTRYDVKSMIDVGCGAGYALDYFKDLGVKVLGVEGCQEALDNNLVSPEELVKHDYENDGVYAPDQEFDLCWSCEFVEHVTAAEMPNFIETFILSLTITTVMSITIEVAFSIIISRTGTIITIIVPLAITKV